MRIGLDLDNTIIGYDRLFYRLAVERDLIPRNVPATKSAVRDYLRKIGREEDWTALQGEAYGPRIDEADIFPGVIDFLSRSRAQGHDVCIISHKTQRPYRGPDVDLHASAMRLLRNRGLFETSRTGLDEGGVWFELTKESKLTRIASEHCEWFMDDLPEFLAEPAFPKAVHRVLFDPMDQAADAKAMTTLNGCMRVRSWREASERIFEQVVRT